MARVYNFSAGPAVLPEEVLKEAAEEMLDYRGCGMSVMEMSHRSKMFDDIIKTAEADLRELMNIPDNYKVLFLQGGASQQFSAIPMNLMKNKVADFIITGQWAKKAYQEASRYGKANILASSEDKTYTYIPDCSDLPVSEDADYVYVGLFVARQADVTFSDIKLVVDGKVVTGSDVKPDDNKPGDNKPGDNKPGDNTPSTPSDTPSTPDSDKVNAVIKADAGINIKADRKASCRERV